MEFNLFDPINHNLNELSALLTSTAQALDSLQLSTESNSSLLMKPMDSSSSNGGLLDSGDSGIWSGASTSESPYPCTPPPTRTYDCASSMWSFSPSSYFNSSSTSFSSSSSSNSVDKGAEGLYNGNGSWSSSLPSSPSALHSSSIGSSASSCFSRQMNSNSPPPGMLPIGYNSNNANLRQTLQLLNALQQELQEKEAANISPWNSPSRTEEINSLVSSVHQLIATLKHQAPAPSPPPSSPVSDIPSSPQGGRDSGRFRKSSIVSVASSSAAPQKQYHNRGGSGNQPEARYTWSGQLPARVQKNPSYSCKVFLGGVPCEISMGTLLRAFQPFGNVKVEWPGKLDNPPSPQRYAYLIFEHERQVKHLLQNCMYKYGKEGSYFFKLTSKRLRYHSKDIQVIPWSIGDSNYVRCETSKLDPQRTIFVGALHGMINAEALATIMQELFGGVVYAGIDTDKNRYPIGSARVTFSNRQSYMKAVAAEYVEIRTPKFFKTVQVDPYLEDATCSICALQQGPYFCRSLSCFKYFCRTCFEIQHIGESLQSHRPIMRNANRQNGSSPATSM